MPPLLLLLPGLALLAAPPGAHPRPPAAPFSPAAAAARQPANGPAPAAPVERDDCVHQGLPFQVGLVKVPGAEAPDDLALVLEQRGRRLEARLPGQPASRWWKLGPVATGPDWKAPRSCGRVESVPTTAGRLLLFALTDGRPGADHLQGILYEVRGQRILDVVDLGPLAALDAFREGAAFVRLAAQAEAADAPAAPDRRVRRVWTAGNRIHSRAEPERPTRAPAAP